MVRAWAEAPLNYKGRFFSVSLPELRPVPVQRPHPPIWHSVVTAESFEVCGRKGVPILTVRLPVGLIADRLGLYRRGLATSGRSETDQAQLLANAGLWRWIYVGESRAEAEDEFAAALLHTRQHMNHARQELNPADFAIPEAVLNPWTDSRVGDSDAIRFALQNGTILGTADDVAEQIAEVRDAGVGHVLAQMSFGYLGHERIVASMRRFGEKVVPRFR
jgi:alkanesulfonate monooxygenase SsuD/methylene tetrahydromethanopterin reductase-like flavin-dependent oxidoreductase (luciferase family)